MAYLWIILAGAVVFAVASFLPWLGISFLGSPTANFNMWTVLGLTEADVVFRVSLGLALMSIVAILILTLIQLFRRRTVKGLTIGVFTLSLITLIPLLWSLSTFRPVFQAVASKESSLGVIFAVPQVGYPFSLVGSVTVIVGSVIGLFSKKRKLNNA